MSSPQPPAPSGEPNYSDIYRHSRREAVIIFCVWIAAILWAVPYCYMNGYPRQFDPETFPTVFGVPAWLFWGIAAPWLVADVFTTWFCFCYMKDDDLGETHEGADLAEEIEELHHKQQTAADSAESGGGTGT